MSECVAKTTKIRYLRWIYVYLPINENFSIQIHQILTIAIVSEDEIPEVFIQGIEIMTDNANDFVQWFEDNYEQCLKMFERSLQQLSG